MAQESSSSLTHKPRTLRFNVKLISPVTKIVARTKEALIDAGTLGILFIPALVMSIDDYARRMGKW